MRNMVLISLIISLSAAIIFGTGVGRTAEMNLLQIYQVDGVAAPGIMLPLFWEDETSVQPQLQSEYSLSTVNGLSLYDNLASTVDRLGSPAAIDVDEWRTDLLIYDYSGMKVAFYGDYIQYVIIELTQQLVIDGVPVESNRKALIEALGQPDYIAEDGIVFQRDEALLKLFIDMETNQLSHISYYHIASV